MIGALPVASCPLCLRASARTTMWTPSVASPPSALGLRPGQRCVCILVFAAPPNKGKRRIRQREKKQKKERARTESCTNRISTSRPPPCFPLGVLTAPAGDQHPTRTSPKNSKTASVAPSFHSFPTASAFGCSYPQSLPFHSLRIWGPRPCTRRICGGTTPSCRNCTTGSRSIPS